MVILAGTREHKGRQLEALTEKLLRHCGYKNCTTNVMASGAEIDVRGELPLLGLGQERHQTMVCECKAQKTAVDMTQWCKFLGKVYHQEVCEQAEVAGCFISLTGVNGHVQGNFDEFCRHKKNISLLHGDQLTKYVSEIIPFVSLEVISNKSRAVTPRVASRFELAYHDGAIYWIVVFSGGEFTLFSAIGELVDAELATTLAEFVKAELDTSCYVNIKEEVHAQRRAELARVLVVATLFEGDGRVKGIGCFNQVDDFSATELQLAAERLIEEGHLVLDDEGEVCVPASLTDEGVRISAELYRILLGTAFPARVLASAFYQRHINRALLREICEIQFDMPLRAADADEIIHLLQLSPSALAQALRPMQMIVTARERREVNEEIARFHRAQPAGHAPQLGDIRRPWSLDSKVAYLATCGVDEAWLSRWRCRCQ